MIPSAETKAVYLGDGETTVFPFSFKYSAVALLFCKTNASEVVFTNASPARNGLKLSKEK